MWGPALSHQGIWLGQGLQLGLVPLGFVRKMGVSFLTTMPRITWSFCSQALDPLARPTLEGGQQAKHGFLVLGPEQRELHLRG